MPKQIKCSGKRVLYKLFFVVLGGRAKKYKYFHLVKVSDNTDRQKSHCVGFSFDNKSVLLSCYFSTSLMIERHMLFDKTFSI